MSLSLTALLLVQLLAAPLAPPAATAPPPCGHDAREPNDTRARARSGGDGPTSGVTCAADPDWFYFDAVRGERLEAVVDLEHDARVRVDVFAPRRRKVLARGPHARFAAPTSGRYRVRIRGEAATETGYTLRINRRSAK